MNFGVRVDEVRKKMCAKMEKGCIGWLTELLYELAAAIFRCWGHINQRYPQNIAA